MLKIIPLGGLGEIGLNMMVFEYDETIIMVDAGLMFPEDYMLGVDIVIPDLTYVREKSSQIAAVFLTHSHEDHIGALPYLLKEVNPPVYGTPFTMGIVRNKLSEHDVAVHANLNDLKAGENISIGPFNIEFIRVNHSTVDGVGLAIKTPEGLIIHTGDFKINNTVIAGMMTDVNRFARHGEEGVLALLSDSTNVEKEGYTISDMTVGDTLDRIIASSKGRVIIALFASNVARIQQLVDIAIKRKRKIIFNGRSIELSVSVAKSLGFMDFPDDLIVDIRQLGLLSDKDVLIITTGSQGEPMSALARMSSGVHKQIRIKEDDTVVLSSKFIPGNERAITNIINSLYRKGANVIYDKISEIHVSGHAFQEELKLMISLTKPKYFMPVHGEYRHLIHHGRLAEQVGIPGENILIAENGDIVVFDENGGRIVESVQTGRVLIDGKGVGDVGRSVLKERRALSEDGIVVVTMILDEETGTILYGPKLESRGFVFWMETGHLVEDAQCVILEIVEEVMNNSEIGQHDRPDIIKNRLQKALRQYFYFTIERRPVILPQVIEV
ncbi:ribonuclease J [Desulforegula conservatrix]|uniref:ribonuclease J n=1 Tax=Desulforegula conservatrix TaxID=153026 RepID=UPI00042675AC|nr:ribonuclease J [Desulforegula conservatrix]